VLALVACALFAVPHGAARGNDAAEIPRGARVIKIGPQAVVIQDAKGHVRMYDDPSQQARPCKSKLSCMGPALQVLSVFGVLVYEELTTAVEGTEARVTDRIGPLE
jgi:hypothetical protein